MVLRTWQARQLLEKYPHAWLLLSQIAYRARWHSAKDKLEVGNAQVGDHEKCGLTRKQYRTALDILVRLCLIQIVRKTNRGCVVRLVSNVVFDINEGHQQRKKGPPREQKGASSFTYEKRADGATKSGKCGHQNPQMGPLTNNDSKKVRKNDSSKALGSSLAVGIAKIRAESSSFSGSYQNHKKWKEYSDWCYSQGGTPTGKGFDTWLLKQKPQWRDKVKEVSEERGYVLDGKFYSQAEANRLAVSDSDLIDKFRTATRRNGKIIL